MGVTLGRGETCDWLLGEANPGEGVYCKWLLALGKSLGFVIGC